MTTDHDDTTIPIDGRERLVYIPADGTWIELADSAGQVDESSLQH